MMTFGAPCDRLVSKPGQSTNFECVSADGLLLDC